MRVPIIDFYKYQKSQIRTQKVVRTVTQNKKYIQSQFCQRSENDRKLEEYIKSQKEFQNGIQAKFNKMIENLEIPAELSKVEPIIKNEKIEEKYNNWNERYEELKQDDILRINDMIVDLDISTNRKDYNEYMKKISLIEIEIAKSKSKSDTLLDEIKEITLSEEKYRSIIIKLRRDGVI